MKCRARGHESGVLVPCRGNIRQNSADNLLLLLAAAGCNYQQIALALEEIENERDAVLAEKQSALEEHRRANAARQAAWRERHRGKGNVRSRYVTSRNGDPPQHIDPPKEQNPKKDSAYARKTALPPDFVVDREYAIGKGWDAKKAEFEEERFSNHAKATGRRQVDWTAAWRNWVTSSFQSPTNGVNGHATDAEFRTQTARQHLEAIHDADLFIERTKSSSVCDSGPATGLLVPAGSRR